MAKLTESSMHHLSNVSTSKHSFNVGKCT